MRYNKQGSRKTARLQITKIKSILSGFEIVAPAVIIQRIHKALVDIVKHLARADCNAGNGILRKKHNLLIGERTGEEMKIRIGSAYPRKEQVFIDVKGRNLISGLPQAITIGSN